RDDADRRPFQIDAATERQPNRYEQHRVAASELPADAEHQGAVQRKIDGVRQHALARFDTQQENRRTGTTGVEHPAAEADVELAARLSECALERRAAAIREADDEADLRPGKGSVGRVEAGHARRLS